MGEQLEIVLHMGEIFLLASAAVLFVPSAFFLLECLVARGDVKAAAWDANENLRIVVLVPAQDEAANLAVTLESVNVALTLRAEILVVADNCTDDTANVARACDVQVIERNDRAHVGKGFALAFGIKHLAPNPPEVVIVLDADSFVDRAALAQLAQCAHASGRPAQAANRWLEARADSSTLALSNFAFLVKNIVRPAALRRLGAPCLLMGNGMAFPWAALANASLATGHLSEDMWWSVELTCAGYAPLFCPEALVYSAAPQRAAVMKAQRARWERGHLETMVAGIPKLLHAAFAQRRVEPLWLALELSVPPLALLTLGLTILFVLTATANWFGIAGTAFWLVTMNLFLVGIGVFAAWWKFGRAQISLRALLAAPWYVLVKIPLYVRALFGKRIVWRRTARDAASLHRE